MAIYRGAACAVCDGTGKVTCDACDGSGYIRCELCNGLGQRVLRDVGQTRAVPCSCGSGGFTCTVCSGGSGMCGACDGTGRLMRGE